MAMPELNIGRQGAARQTWRDKNFRELLVGIIAASPTGPESKWRQEFRDQPLGERWLARHKRTVQRRKWDNGKSVSRLSASVGKSGQERELLAGRITLAEHTW
jgi:hypothetical protein